MPTAIFRDTKIPQLNHLTLKLLGPFRTTEQETSTVVTFRYDQASRGLSLLVDSKGHQAAKVRVVKLLEWLDKQDDKQTAVTLFIDLGYRLNGCTGELSRAEKENLIALRDAVRNDEKGGQLCQKLLARAGDSKEYSDSWRYRSAAEYWGIKPDARICDGLY